MIVIFGIVYISSKLVSFYIYYIMMNMIAFDKQLKFISWTECNKLICIR